MLNVKQGSCEYQFFVVFGLTWPGIETKSTISVADVLSTRTIMELQQILQQIITLTPDVPFPAETDCLVFIFNVFRLMF